MKTLYLECGMGAAGDMLMAALTGLLPDPQGFAAELNALGIPGVRARRLAAESCGITGARMEISINGEEEESQDWHAHGHAHGGLEHSHGHAHPHDHDHNHDDHDHHDHHHDDHDHDHHHDDHDDEHDHHHDDHDHDHDHGDHDHEHHDDHCDGHGHHDDHGHDHHHGGHDHPHNGHGGHGHATRGETMAVIAGLAVSEKVKQNAAQIYDLLADAEAEAHGKPVDQVHFHEVGNMDAVADIVGVCLLMEKLAPDSIVVSPIRTGYGFVRCAHGVLPVPAPAAANLLRGMPVYAGEIQGEMCTPTGAALLKHFATEFGPMPAMTVEKIGVGMGKKDFGVANCLRAFLGESGEDDGPNERIYELSCNLDDMTGEDIAYAAEKLLKAGALDVFTQPILMKKGRPATLLTCLCKEGERNRFAGLMLLHTSSFGVRAKLCERFALNREWVKKHTEFGEIGVKRGFGYGVDKQKPEYEDIKRAAEAANVPLETVRRGS